MKTEVSRHRACTYCKDGGVHIPIRRMVQEEEGSRKENARLKLTAANPQDSFGMADLCIQGLFRAHEVSFYRPDLRIGLAALCLSDGCAFCTLSAGWVSCTWFVIILEIPHTVYCCTWYCIWSVQYQALRITTRKLEIADTSVVHRIQYTANAAVSKAVLAIRHRAFSPRQEGRSQFSNEHAPPGHDGPSRQFL